MPSASPVLSLDDSGGMLAYTYNTHTNTDMQQLGSIALELLSKGASEGYSAMHSVLAGATNSSDSNDSSGGYTSLFDRDDDHEDAMG